MSQLPRVLVVDDDLGTLETFGLSLRNVGFDVEAAGTASEAYTAALQQPFHVIVTDLVLPDFDGITLLKRLQDAGNASKKIVVTAFGSIGTAVDAIKLGAHTYVEKPLDSSNLIRLVCEAAGVPVPAFDSDVDSAASACDRRIARVLQLLEQDVAARTSIDELAAHVDLSASRLRHVFRAAMGMSLASYRRHRRLVAAAGMLAHTDLRVSAIADTVGFETAAYFDLAFRRQYGMSPTAYRRSHRR